MSKKGGFAELLYSSIMPKIYGVGASVVIIGALFKILHFPGAALMLGLGLTTEAVIFFLSSFEPKHTEIDWSKVYPELSDDFEGSAPRRLSPVPNKGASAYMDKVLTEAKVGPELIKSLGMGMRSLADSAKRMSQISNATLVTNEYSSNVREASKSVSELNKSYVYAMKSMVGMANASKNAKEYHGQIGDVTKKLEALNSVYDMEIKDAQSHTKALNKFYSNMNSALERMADVGRESTSFQNQLNQLTSNITSLNKVYGNMLTAMRGNNRN